MGDAPLTGCWRPDGQPLPPEARVVVDRNLAAGHPTPVHLRLRDRNQPGRWPIAACGGRSLGGWWSGDPTETTCPYCLETLHS